MQRVQNKHRLIVVDTQWQYQHVNKFQISIFYGLAWKWYSKYTVYIWPCYDSRTRTNYFPLVFYIVNLLAGGQFKWMTDYNSLHLKTGILNPYIDATKRSHFAHWRFLHCFYFHSQFKSVVQYPLSSCIDIL